MTQSVDLAAADGDQLPRVTEFINAPGPGNDHFSRSERVKKQLRDKHGKWIRMHSSVIVHAPLSENNFTGKVTSIDTNANLVHVKIDGTTAVAVVDPKNIEAVAAVLHPHPDEHNLGEQTDAEIAAEHHHGPMAAADAPYHDSNHDVQQLNDPPAVNVDANGQAVLDNVQNGVWVNEFVRTDGKTDTHYIVGHNYYRPIGWSSQGGGKNVDFNKTEQAQLVAIKRGTTFSGSKWHTVGVFQRDDGTQFTQSLNTISKWTPTDANLKNGKHPDAHGLSSVGPNNPPLTDGEKETPGIPSYSPDELAAIKDYTYGAHTVLNGHLRGDGHYSVTESDLEKISRLDTAIEKSTTSKDLTLWRAAGAGSVSWLPDHLEPGTEIQDKGFISTTTNEGLVTGDYSEFDNSIQFEIQAPAGVHAIDVRKALNENPKSTEDEFILNRGTKLRVISDTGVPDDPYNGIRHVKLEVIDNGDTSGWSKQPEAVPTAAQTTPEVPVEEGGPDHHTAPDTGNTFDATNWEKIGNQAGSNPGGTYQDPAGERWYIKIAQSDDHARNEAAASAFYRELGVDVPEVLVGKQNGKTAIGSKLVPGAVPNLKEKLKDSKYRHDLQNGFVADAWLANWDVAGLEFDNVVTGSDSKPWRIDTGGSLLYRAMGTPKGHAFGDTVGELETLRDPKMNPQSSQVFGDVGEARIKEQVQHLADTMTDEKIDSLVEAQGFDGNVSFELKSTLKNRRDYLKNKYGANKADQPDESLDELGNVEHGWMPSGLSTPVSSLKEGDKYHGVSAISPSGNGKPSGEVYTVDKIEKFNDNSYAVTTTDEGGFTEVTDLEADAPVWTTAPDYYPVNPDVASGNDSAPGLSHDAEDTGPFQLGWGGEKLQVGHKVKSKTDGAEGEIVKLESNGLYAKVKMLIDGKIKGRKSSTLIRTDKQSETSPTEPQVLDKTGQELHVGDKVQTPGGSVGTVTKVQSSSMVLVKPDEGNKLDADHAYPYGPQQLTKQVDVGESSSPHPDTGTYSIPGVNTKFVVNPDGSVDEIGVAGTPLTHAGAGSPLAASWIKAITSPGTGASASWKKETSVEVKEGDVIKAYGATGIVKKATAEGVYYKQTMHASPALLWAPNGSFDVVHSGDSADKSFNIDDPSTYPLIPGKGPGELSDTVQATKDQVDQGHIDSFDFEATVPDNAGNEVKYGSVITFNDPGADFNYGVVTGVDPEYGTVFFVNPENTSDEGEVGGLEVQVVAPPTPQGSTPEWEKFKTESGANDNGLFFGGGGGVGDNVVSDKNGENVTVGDTVLYPITHDGETEHVEGEVHAIHGGEIEIKDTHTTGISHYVEAEHVEKVGGSPTLTSLHQDSVGYYVSQKGSDVEIHSDGAVTVHYKSDILPDSYHPAGSIEAETAIHNVTTNPNTWTKQSSSPSSPTITLPGGKSYTLAPGETAYKGEYGDMVVLDPGGESGTFYYSSGTHEPAEPATIEDVHDDVYWTHLADGPPPVKVNLNDHIDINGVKAVVVGLDNHGVYWKPLDGSTDSTLYVPNGSFKIAGKSSDGGVTSHPLAGTYAGPQGNVTIHPDGSVEHKNTVGTTGYYPADSSWAKGLIQDVQAGVYTKNNEEHTATTSTVDTSGPFALSKTSEKIYKGSKVTYISKKHGGSTTGIVTGLGGGSSPWLKVTNGQDGSTYNVHSNNVTAVDNGESSTSSISGVYQSPGGTWKYTIHPDGSLTEESSSGHSKTHPAGGVTTNDYIKQILGPDSGYKKIGEAGNSHQAEQAPIAAETPPPAPTQETYTPKPGEKFILGNGNVPIYKGSKVVSLKDGLEGEVITLEKNGEYVKVKGADGKIKGRKAATLKVTAHPNGSTPNHANASNAPSINDVGTPEPVEISKLPEEAKKYVGAEQPSFPQLPDTVTSGPYVPADWLDKVKARYADFAPGKQLESSANWTRVQSVINSGDLTALEHLLTRKYLDQGLYAEAKAMIDTKQAEHAALVTQHQLDVKEWQKQLLLWQKANGVTGGVFSPEGFILKGLAGARDWSTASEGTSWAKSVWPNSSHYTSAQLSSLKGYTGSSYSSINSNLWKLGAASQTSVTGSTANIDSAMNHAPRVPEDIIARRGVGMNAFKMKNGLNFSNYGMEDFNQIKGTVQVNWGFSSSSVNTHAAFSSHNVQMNIRVPKGFKAVYVHANGISGHSEYELLLDRGAHFFVHDVKQVNGKWVIDVEIVPPGWDGGGKVTVLAALEAA